MKFDRVRFAKEVVWGVLAGIAGVGAVVSSNPKVLEDIGNGSMTMPAILMLGYGAFRASVGWLKGHLPEDSALRKVL